MGKGQMRKDQGMKGQVTVAALAERLGITRSNLHKRIRREGVRTSKMPCTTGGGVQTLTTVPLSFAKRLIRHYEEAKANATSGAAELFETGATRGTT
jgi:transposase-like protein